MFLAENSDGSTIRGVAIVNGSTGILIRSGNDVIAGNFLGVDPDGTTFAGGTNNAVDSDFGIGGTVIGGTTPAARNLIASLGTSLEVDTNGTVAQGNYFNTNAAGTKALTAAGFAVTVGATSDGALIGGTSAGAGNVFGAWRSAAINMSGGSADSPVTNVSVKGNLIGTNAAGTAKLNGGLAGLALGRVDGVTVTGNVISGAQNDGILMTGELSGVVIQGNKIGTDITGKKEIPNGECGIRIRAGSTEGLIGGTSAGEGNVIAFNATQGVNIEPGNTGWQILGNSIFSNHGLGISLGGRPDIALTTATANDPQDTDTGPNNLQNYPLVKSVNFTSGDVTIGGTLNSTPNTAFRLEFFSDPSRDVSGFGEGKTFLGSTNVTTNANGNASYSATFPIVAQNEPVITATATDAAGNTSEFSAAFASRLQNISTRMPVLTSDKVLIAGFIITGSGPKNVLIRGLGPSLADLNISGVLADPTLELHGDASASNDNWKDAQRTAIEATGIPPKDDAESAILATLNPGSYTAVLAGKDGGTGVGLVELYDLSVSSGSILANLSSRGFVDVNDSVMIGGFIVGPQGTGAATVLLRALGPSLTNSGVQNALSDPTLELHDGNGTTIATNDNWKVDDATGTSQEAAIEATSIPPSDPRECALLRTLTPGNYTAIVRGKNNTTGVASVEIYNLQ